MWVTEQSDLANRNVWCEVQECYGPAGALERPWLVQVNVYSRVSDDIYGHSRRALVDAVKGALNVASALIYDFGSTDASRASPTTTGYYFYPRVSDEGVLPEVGDGVEGYYIRYRCYSYRTGMVGA